MTTTQQHPKTTKKLINEILDDMHPYFDFMDNEACEQALNELAGKLQQLVDLTKAEIINA